MKRTKTRNNQQQINKQTQYIKPKIMSHGSVFFFLSPFSLFFFLVDCTTWRQNPPMTKTQHTHTIKQLDTQKVYGNLTHKNLWKYNKRKKSMKI